MDIYEALIAYLLSYPGLSALVGNRIYPDILPEKTAFPTIAVVLVSRVRDHLFQADSSMVRSRYQFSVFGNTRKEVNAVAKQIRLALQNYTGTMGGAAGVSVSAVEMDGEVDNFETDTQLYSKMLDFLIWHEE